ncbi:probable glycosyltransferase At3g07620 [Morus notabilis]|uniref:probable glycosyltransferase At3g07620 n=1 Tax=Morus notabilis TaxID=981085 RepID=UPI000CECECD3|nr:probable glycosyltransferase At3g07620 [Morus notabilis]XP_024025281.1 probable glycosyltransferase At3g07620 [Morus notabilis]
MVQKLSNLCQVETRRLIWIIGLLFALILAFQYFELPYGSFSSLTSTGKVPVQGKSSQKNGDSLSSASNYTDRHVIKEPLNDTRTSSSAPEGNGDADNSGGEDSSSRNLVKQNKTLEGENVENVDDGLAQDEEAEEPDQSFNGNVHATGSDNSTSKIEKDATNLTTSDKGENSDSGPPSPSPSTPLIDSPPSTAETVSHTNVSTPATSSKSDPFLVEKEKATSEKEKEAEGVPSDLSHTEKTPPVTAVPNTNTRPQMPVLDLYTLSDMNNLLLQSRASYYSVIPRWSSAVDKELRDVALQIENAPIVQNDPNLYAPLYRNISIFRRSYELMEKTLQVYIYREGERPILHTPILRGLYASEGWFMKLLEANKKFVTKNPRKAHLFYLPFSSRMLEETLYVPNSHNHKALIRYLEKYVDMIAGKYPYWNRTGGADHFLVACHDWAPAETRHIMATCIRALCNSDVKEGFVFGKDVSLPETYIHLPKNPLRDLGGKPLRKRSTLAFFAGSMHGYLRPILLQHWENKDPDMKIFGRLPKSKNNRNYVNFMKTSKYCICAKGFEVNSPRVVEAIFFECVPVIISDDFVPPFFEILNWESFAVFVLEKDIPNLKKILLSIPEKRYRQMQMRVKKVQKHFLWHSKPEKYDIFHMILHSVWYSRLHQIRPI